MSGIKFKWSDLYFKKISRSFDFITTLNLMFKFLPKYCGVSTAAWLHPSFMNYQNSTF